MKVLERNLRDLEESRKKSDFNKRKISLDSSNIDDYKRKLTTQERELDEIKNRLQEQNLHINNLEARLIEFVHQQMENQNLFNSQEEALKAQFDEMEKLETEIKEHLDLRKKKSHKLF